MSSVARRNRVSHLTGVLRGSVGWLTPDAESVRRDASPSERIGLGGALGTPRATSAVQLTSLIALDPS